MVAAMLLGIVGCGPKTEDTTKNEDKVLKIAGLDGGYGKEAMMFLGDNWIGVEPYGKYFKSIGLDAVVGSVGGGATPPRWLEKTGSLQGTPS